MRKALIVIFALAAFMSYGQAAVIDSDTLFMNGAQVYIAMVHTPHGFKLQRAPLAVDYYGHLVIGSGPQTVEYVLLGTIADFYDGALSGIGSSRTYSGTVEGNGSVSFRAGKPGEAELFALPAGVESSVRNVRMAVLVLYGRLNRPSFKEDDRLSYWLRPMLNAPLETVDGPLSLSYPKLELGLYVYFTEDCILNGDYVGGEFTYRFTNVQVRRGWNMLGLTKGDGSDLFKGLRYVVALVPSTPVYEVFVPFW